MPAATRTPPRFLTLILLAGLSVGALNMFLPSLANIAQEFQADYGLVNLSIAGYAAVTALLQLVMGPLSDRFGRRPVMLSALVLFVLASLGCMVATDIWTFLVLRMVQGVIVAGYIVSMAVIRDTVAAQKAASLIGYLAMAWAIAPMLGPMLGGALDELFGWRASFVAFFTFGLAVLALCWFDLGETNRSTSATLNRQFRAYPELLGSRRFWGYALCMAFSTGAFYAFLGGAPLVASAVFAMSPGTLGFCLGTITAGFVLGSFLAGRFSARHSLTTMMITGRLVACTGLLLGLACVLAGIVEATLFFGACVFVGVGNGITMPSSMVGAMSVRASLTGTAAGLAGALTVAGGAVISAITGAILTPANAPQALLATMLASSALALAAALYVRWLDRNDPPAAPTTRDT